jgi:hypothetical protein
MIYCDASNFSYTFDIKLQFLKNIIGDREGDNAKANFYLHLPIHCSIKHIVGH